MDHQDSLPPLGTADASSTIPQAAASASIAPVSRIEAIRQRVIQRQLLATGPLDPQVAIQPIGLGASSAPPQQALLPSLVAIRTRLRARQAVAAALERSP
jgi:hypothetical protein